MTESYEMFVEIASDIKIICKPLYKLGILHFTHLRNYEDGRQLYLSNNAKWTEDYYANSLYASSLFEAKPIHYKNSYILWPIKSSLEVFDYARIHFDSDNGITIVSKKRHYCDFYFFSGTSEDHWLYNFYLNHLDLLKAFIKYFNEKTVNLIRRLEQRPYYFVDRYEVKRDLSLLQKGPESLSKHIKEFNQVILPGFASDEAMAFSKLTRQERETLTYLLRGMTAKQTARVMSLSHRTIEIYLDNIRRKTQSTNKLELINKARLYIAMLNSKDETKTE